MLVEFRNPITIFGVPQMVKIGAWGCYKLRESYKNYVGMTD